MSTLGLQLFMYVGCIVLAAVNDVLYTSLLAKLDKWAKYWTWNEKKKEDFFPFKHCTIYLCVDTSFGFIGFLEALSLLLFPLESTQRTIKANNIKMMAKRVLLALFLIPLNLFAFLLELKQRDQA